MNKLPKSWAVLNDGSRLFKDTVIKYLNKNHNGMFDGTDVDTYYGLDTDDLPCINDTKGLFDTILTLEQFIELTKI